MKVSFLNWSTFEADSNVSLPNLREGNYEIRCQLSENSFSVSDPLTIRFQILPPWYRSYVAYFLYFLASLAVIYLLIHWSLHRTRRHNRRLTKLVNERTNKLEETMDKLAHETRNAATLAERDRLAGEIHDSVQQGLTGLMIHLDGMLRSPIMSEALRPSIGTAKKMLDYTRKEVQHALLDMESPLLEDSDITRALKRIADLIPSESTQIELKTTGEPVPIPSYHAHQLLRICQEAMTNAVRHGHAKQIILRLHYTETSLSLKIEDDGTGFDPSSSIDQTHHFGLRGMRKQSQVHGL